MVASEAWPAFWNFLERRRDEAFVAGLKPRADRIVDRDDLLVTGTRIVSVSRRSGKGDAVHKRWFVSGGPQPGAFHSVASCRWRWQRTWTDPQAALIGSDQEALWKEVRVGITLGAVEWCSDALSTAYRTGCLDCGRSLAGSTCAAPGMSTSKLPSGTREALRLRRLGP